MKTLIIVLSLVGFSIAGTSVAADAKKNQETLIAQCTQAAKTAGVKEAEMDAYINSCLDDKLGYVKGNAGGGGD